MNVTIRVEDPDQPEILSLLREADSWYISVYPPEHTHLLDMVSLKRPEVSFHVARVEGRVAGFGAMVRQPAGFGEIKRMYVDPAFRGNHVGRLILGSLEAHARRLGLRLIRLETGPRQLAAIGLYRASGYGEIAAFAPYDAGPFSLFFEKRVAD